MDFLWQPSRCLERNKVFCKKYLGAQLQSSKSKIQLKRNISALAFSSFMFMPALSAETVSNKDLTAACLDPSQQGQNFCYGFIISTTNAAQFYRNIVDVEDTYLDICFPEDISNEEIVKLYLEWVRKNPELSASPAFVGVSTSFSSKYSCKK